MRSPVVLGIALALMVALAGLGWFLQQRGSPVTETLEVATTTPQSALPRDVGATVVLTTRDGRTLTVPDFTYGHPSVEVIDTGRTYIYVTQNDDLMELDPRYGIIYGNDHTFKIALLAPPLASSQQAAEAKLREFLPVPDDILCTLRVEVRAADTIDARYAGRELGLSFCPGSVPLP